MKKLLLLLLSSWLCASAVLLCGSSSGMGERAGSAAAEKEKQPAPRRRKTWRAFLENATLLTGSTIDYWRTYSHFVEDWQFKFTWKDQRRRFFTSESPKMDSNSFWFNWSHAMSGAAYYNFARANGLNSRVSFLFSYGISAFWETVSEWREIISVNDMTFTPLGGPAIGEPLFQIGSYFSHRQGFFNRLAGFIFNPILATNNWFDRNSGQAFNSGAAAAWHRFSLFVGLKEGKVAPTGTSAVSPSAASYRQSDWGLDMETNTVPGYGEAQTFHRFLSDTISSRMFLDFNFGSAGLEEFQIRTSAVLFGYAWQSVHEGSDGTLSGSSGSLGYGCVFDMFKKRAVAWYDSSAEVPGGGPALSDARFPRPTPTQFTDKLAVVSVLGPVLQLGWFGPRIHLRWTTEAYGDFAMINSLAYNRFTENHDTSGVKTTLLNWGYYYGLGMTLASDLAADWRRLYARGSVRYQWYDSIQGQDRYQFLGVVTDDFKIHDSRLVWRFSLGYHLPRTPLELVLNAEGVSRSGRILEVREHYREHKILLSTASALLICNPRSEGNGAWRRNV